MELDYLADHPRFIDELARFHFAEWGHLRPEETLAQRTARLAAHCGRRALPAVIVAHEGDKLIGSAMLLACDMSSRSDLTPWLGGVFVAEPFRRAGVGARLVRRVEADAVALGFKRLFLYTPSQAAWYARLGWERLEERTYLGVAVTVMITRLDREGREDAGGQLRS